MGVLLWGVTGDGRSLALTSRKIVDHIAGHPSTPHPAAIVCGRDFKDGTCEGIISVTDAYGLCYSRIVVYDLTRSAAIKESYEEIVEHAHTISRQPEDKMQARWSSLLAQRV
jgi:hypothetical protein